MLKLKHLFENYDLAKKALEHWRHDEDNLDQMLSQFRISSNAIYPFKQNKDICFLRLAPVDEKQKQNLIGELEFIEYLIKNDFPALEPIKTKNGDLWIEINTQWGRYYATAFKRGLKAYKLSVPIFLMK